MDYLSRAFLEFFPKPVYSTMVVEEFQVYGVKITGKYIYPSKNLPQVFIITLQAEGNYPFLPNSVLWRSIFPQ